MDSQDHVAELRRNIESHVRRLSVLRKFISRAEEEAAVHEALIGLARNDQLLNAIREYSGGDPAAIFELVEGQLDPASPNALRSSQLVSFDFEAGHHSSARMTMQMHCGDWVVEVGWDREEGFFAIPDTRRLRQQVALVNYVDSEPSETSSSADEITEESESYSSRIQMKD
jgi:hypothetical protein